MLTEAMYCNLSPILHENIWYCNLNRVDICQVFRDTIWRDILIAWSTINCNDPQSKGQVSDQVLWYNSNIHIANKPVCWDNWIQAGIMRIGDLCNEYGKLLPYYELPNNLSWLQYESLKSAMPVVWHCFLCDNDWGDEVQPMYDKLKDVNTVTSVVYDLLIEDDRMLLKYFKRWYSILGINVTIMYPEYVECFSNLYKTTKITKYRDFQYCLLLVLHLDVNQITPCMGRGLLNTSSIWRRGTL